MPTGVKSVFGGFCVFAFLYFWVLISPPHIELVARPRGSGGCLPDSSGGVAAAGAGPRVEHGGLGAYPQTGLHMASNSALSVFPAFVSCSIIRAPLKMKYRGGGG